MLECVSRGTNMDTVTHAVTGPADIGPFPGYVNQCINPIDIFASLAGQCIEYCDSHVMHPSTALTSIIVLLSTLARYKLQHLAPCQQRDYDNPFIHHATVPKKTKICSLNKS